MLCLYLWVREIHRAWTHKQLRSRAKNCAGPQLMYTENISPVRLWLPMLLTDRGESNTQVRHLLEEVGIYHICPYITCMGCQSWAALSQWHPAPLLIPRTGRMEADTLPYSALVFLIDIRLGSNAPCCGSSRGWARDGFHCTEGFAVYQVWFAAQCS